MNQESIIITATGKYASAIRPYQNHHEFILVIPGEPTELKLSEMKEKIRENLEVFLEQNKLVVLDSVTPVKVLAEKIEEPSTPSEMGKQTLPEDTETVNQSDAKVLPTEDENKSSDESASPEAPVTAPVVSSELADVELLRSTQAQKLDALVSKLEERAQAGKEPTEKMTLALQELTTEIEQLDLKIKELKKETITE